MLVLTVGLIPGFSTLKVPLKLRSHYNKLTISHQALSTLIDHTIWVITLSAANSVSLSFEDFPAMTTTYGKTETP